METHFPSALGSRGIIVFLPVWFFASCGFQPCFSPGGACFIHVFPAFWSTFSLHSQTKFFLLCMSSIYLGRRPDGSSLILARHHGIPTRVGDGTFSISLLCTGPRPSHSQLHFDSFRSKGLETVEKLKRQTSFAVRVFISIISAISSSSTRASPRNSNSIEWSISI